MKKILLRIALLFLTCHGLAAQKPIDSSIEQTAEGMTAYLHEKLDLGSEELAKIQMFNVIAIQDIKEFSNKYIDEPNEILKAKLEIEKLRDTKIRTVLTKSNLIEFDKIVQEVELYRRNRDRKNTDPIIPSSINAEKALYNF